MKARRFLSVAFALLTIVSLASCSKTEKKILGDWEVTSSVLTEISSAYLNPEFNGSVWTFKDDNTVVCTQDGEAVSGTYTITDDDDLTMTFVQSETDEDGSTWNMKIVFDMDIEEITKSDMTLDGDIAYSFVEIGLNEKAELKMVMKKK